MSVLISELLQNNYSKIIIIIIIIIIIASYYLYCANWHKNMIKCALHKWRIKINNVTPTQSYENRVSKHFVIFLNFPCLIACLLYCLLLLLDCLVVRDLWRILPPPPPPFLPPLPIFFSLPSILSLTQVTVIWNQCAPKAGFGAF